MLTPKDFTKFINKRGNILAEIIDLKTFTDKRGNLTVIEKLPFDIKRVFFIYGCDDSVRGGHRHKKTRQAVACLQGSCIVQTPNIEMELNSLSTCLIIEPEDWHTITHFSKDAILMVLASTEFDENDYIYPACANKECQSYREMYYPNNCAWFTVLADNEVRLLGKRCGDYIEGVMENNYFGVNQRSKDFYK